MTLAGVERLKFAYYRLGVLKKGKKRKEKKTARSPLSDKENVTAVKIERSTEKDTVRTTPEKKRMGSGRRKKMWNY